MIKKNLSEIKIRVAQTKEAFKDLSKILTNLHLSFKTRKRVLGCYITPIMKYGGETWTISKTAVNTTNASEIWYFRKMQKIFYIQRLTKEEV